MDKFSAKITPEDLGREDEFSYTEDPAQFLVDALQEGFYRINHEKLKELAERALQEGKYETDELLFKRSGKFVEVSLKNGGELYGSFYIEDDGTLTLLPF